ncbi:uncharacterized protein LOC131942025 [Physella acuta]|uniref:uncharacterized protein LOC131942025 n=1 Tax=Physella acuta TaxID=109671 RepID=UPI0027DC6807|nr:uncharacterized protein LOC131942025 [Physella acuta]XP_059157669.1 uncharacterized protein LOC131942025 [Physella acuta]XP_059157670.1 uncharacterized protein LOC131942025 [Physella acuta]XP_059157671.1 uncharacterized protein LOC131942025 [Physella acuta]
MEREWRILCVVALISWTHWSLASTESLLDAPCNQTFTSYNGKFYGCLTDNQEYFTPTYKLLELCGNLEDIFVISDINIYSLRPSSEQLHKSCLEKPTYLTHVQYNSSCLMGTKGQAFKDFIYPYFTRFSGKILKNLKLETKMSVPKELKHNDTYIDIVGSCIPDNSNKWDFCQPQNSTDDITKIWLYLNNENTNISQCSCNVRSNSTKTIQIKTLDVRLNGISLRFTGANKPLHLSDPKLYWSHDNLPLTFTDYVDIQLSAIASSLDQIVLLEVTGYNMDVSCGPSVPKHSSPQNPHQAEFKLWYVIVISLAGVLVIILVTVVIICCCRRRKSMSREKASDVIYAEPDEPAKGKDFESKHPAGRAPKDSGRAPKPCHSDTTESLLPPDYFELEKPLPPNNNVGRQDVYNHLREEEKPLPENIYDTTENEYSTLTRVNPKVIDNVYDV